MELVFLIILLVLMAFALASGYPVAFALPGSAILTILLAAGAGYVGAGDPTAYFAHGSAPEWLSAGVINFRGVFWEVERDTLIAIPLFIFMGIMLQRSKIAEDLLLTMAQLFGPIPGGLGISVVFVGALLAATTGILGATVVAMGLISLPAMMRNRYSVPLATGTIAASGTLGQIIPPSIVLIILADQLSSAVDQAQTQRTNLYKENTGELSMPSEFAVSSTSAGDMFLGAMVPGLVLVGLYMLYILVIGLIRPKMAPSVPFTERFDARLIGKILLILIPPLTLIFAVLGSIIAGIATVNQAGAIGAVGATIMAGYRLKEGQKGAFLPAALAIVSLVVIFAVTSIYDLNVRRIATEEDRMAVMVGGVACGMFVLSLIWSLIRTYRMDDTLKGVMIDTATTTSLVFIILLGAAMLTSAFRAFGGEELVKDFLTTLPGGFWTQFIIVMLVIFLLGFFLDFIEIAVVVVPIVAPILLMDPSANITAVWLGVMIGLNIQTSFLTPPFGFALFYLRGVAPKEVRTIDIYKGVVPFIALQLLALVIVGNTPQLVNYLPNRISYSGDNAPPPRNPRLQYCIEEFVGQRFAEDGERIKTAISTARAMPLDTLPKSIASDLTKAFNAADEAFVKMDGIAAAERAKDEASGDYRPVHSQVRALQRDARRMAATVKEDKTLVNRLKSTSPDSPQILELETKIADLEGKQKALLDQIPTNWDEVNTAFAALARAEEQARRQYQRTADSAVEPVIELTGTLRSTRDLAALESDLMGLVADVATGDPKALVERIEALRSAMRAADAGKPTIKGLSDARKALRKDPDPAKATEALTSAQEGLKADLAWRTEATEKALPGLTAYLDGVSDTIGLRQLEKMPREQALYVAACNAAHRNLALNF